MLFPLVSKILHTAAQPNGQGEFQHRPTPEAGLFLLEYDKKALEGRIYPTRLHTIPEKRKRKWVVRLNYLRCYSIWSMLLMFFPAAVRRIPFPRPHIRFSTWSRRLMKGHKWECFVLELSFLGWDLLGILTLGVSDTPHQVHHRHMPPFLHPQQKPDPLPRHLLIAAALQKHPQNLSDIFFTAP